MTKIRDLRQPFEKKHGKGLYIDPRKTVLPHKVRVPTGVLAVDIATGGGFPVNAMTLLHGAQDAMKTTLACCAIREHQRLFPDQTCVFLDVEGSAARDIRMHGERSWMHQLGVDMDALELLIPDHAEAIADMIWAFVQAEDCGLIVVDTLATMATHDELHKKKADEAMVGGSSMVVNRLTRKIHAGVKTALRTEEDRSLPTVIFVNQERAKAAMAYGDPTTLPGGLGQLYLALLQIRLWSKAVLDKDVNSRIAVRREVRGTIKKHKFPVFQQSFEYEMAVLPHNGLRVGQCAGEWSMVRKYMQEYEFLTVKKGGVAIYDIGDGPQEFQTQRELWDWLHEGDHLAKFEHALLLTMSDARWNQGGKKGADEL